MADDHLLHHVSDWRVPVELLAAAMGTWQDFEHLHAVLGCVQAAQSITVLY
jgi:hypothetical protein